MRHAGARFAGLALLDGTIDLKAECRSKAERLRLADANTSDPARNGLVVRVPLDEPLPGCVMRVRNLWAVARPPGGCPEPAEGVPGDSSACGRTQRTLVKVCILREEHLRHSDVGVIGEDEESVPSRATRPDAGSTGSHPPEYLWQGLVSEPERKTEEFGCAGTTGRIVGTSAE